MTTHREYHGQTPTLALTLTRGPHFQSSEERDPLGRVTSSSWVWWESDSPHPTASLQSTNEYTDDGSTALTEHLRSPERDRDLRVETHRAGDRELLQWTASDERNLGPSGATTWSQRREAVRHTYTCSGELVATEVDYNQDGLADERTDRFFDRAGNLLRETKTVCGGRTLSTVYDYTACR